MNALRLVETATFASSPRLISRAGLGLTICTENRMHPVWPRLQHSQVRGRHPQPLEESRRHWPQFRRLSEMELHISNRMSATASFCRQSGDTKWRCRCPMDSMVLNTPAFRLRPERIERFAGHTGVRIPGRAPDLRIRGVTRVDRGDSGLLSSGASSHARRPDGFPACATKEKFHGHIRRNTFLMKWKALKVLPIPDEGCARGQSSWLAR
jgi:hypothetical protein